MTIVSLRQAKMLQYRQKMMVMTRTRVVVEVGRSESLAVFRSSVDDGNVKRGFRITYSSSVVKSGNFYLIL